MINGIVTKSNESGGGRRKHFNYHRVQPIPSSDQHDLHYHIMAQILIACIKQTRQNESFRYFTKPQQDVILRNVWSECFILRASHWSIDVTQVIDRYGTYLNYLEFFFI